MFKKMIIGTIVFLMLCGMLNIATAEPTQGKEIGLGGNININQKMSPYLSQIEDNYTRMYNPFNITDITPTISGDAGTWIYYKFQSVDDAEIVIHYKMGEKVDTTAKITVSGKMPKQMTCEKFIEYTDLDNIPTEQRTMNAELKVMEALIIEGDITLDKDTQAIKKVTVNQDFYYGVQERGDNFINPALAYLNKYKDQSSGINVSYTTKSTDNGYTITINSIDGIIPLDDVSINARLNDGEHYEYLYLSDSFSSDNITYNDNDGNDEVSAGDVISIDSKNFDRVNFWRYTYSYDEDYLNLYVSLKEMPENIKNEQIYTDFDYKVWLEQHSEFDITFTPALDWLQLPIVVDETWNVESNMTVDGTYGGEINAKGLPDWLKDLAEDENITLPMDIANLPSTNANIKYGKISISRPINFYMNCTGTETITDYNGDSIETYQLNIVDFNFYNPFYFTTRGSQTGGFLYSEDVGFIVGIGSETPLGDEFTMISPSEALKNIEETEDFGESIEGEIAGDDLMTILLQLVLLAIVIIIVATIFIKKSGRKKAVEIQEKEEESAVEKEPMEKENISEDKPS